MALRVLSLSLLVAGVNGLTSVENHRHKLKEFSLEAVARDDVQQSIKKGAALLEDPTITTTTSTSWFQRMQDSLSEFIFGVVVIVFAIPVLWVNESRAAQMESLMAHGKSAVRSVGGTPGDVNNGCLVHVAGEAVTSAAPLADDQFQIEFQNDCVRLRSKVEVYQVIQHESKHEREKLGGGKETITTYTYSEEWSSSFENSDNYQDRSKRVNTKLAGLTVGSSVKDCPVVEFGTGFVLSRDLVQQCNKWTDAQKRLPDTLRLKAGSAAEFKADREGHFVCEFGGDRRLGRPNLGDARVKIEYVGNHEATVVALQSNDAPGKTSFLPYRAINRGWFGISGEAEKALLTKEGKKSSGDLAREANCGGVFACLCCACNLVNMCFRSILAPEICQLFDGKMDVDSCFTSIADMAAGMKWVFRVVGWLMLLVGSYSLFSPFLTLIKVIPFLGPLVATIGGMLIWFLCLMATFVIASAVIVVAYLFYHPLLALLYATTSAALAAGVYLLATHL